MDYDAAFCPVCDRQIIPKRMSVAVDENGNPIPEPSTVVPPPPPSSPNHVQRRKQIVRGGLVHGTGRIRPNGSIKGQMSTEKVVPVVPKKSRVFIDQGPYPLYCSEECRLLDLRDGDVVPQDFNPNRDSTPAARRPTPIGDLETAPSSSLSSLAEKDSDSDPYMSPSLATLSKVYNFGPLPPPVECDDVQYDKRAPAAEYKSGIMTAHKYLQSTASSPVSKTHVDKRFSSPPERRVVPGWNDGSNAWRAVLYSFAAVPPSSSSSSSGLDYLESSRNETMPCKAYDGFVASPHRSASARQPRMSASAPSKVSSIPSRQRSETDELMQKFSASFIKRSESRTSISSMSSSPSRSPPKHNRTIIPHGAESKLLIPDVMKSSYTSTSSPSTAASSASPRTPSSHMVRNVHGRHSSGYTYSKPFIRSPLAGEVSLPDVSDSSESVVSGPGLSKPKRPVVESRSWSYDNVRTYDIMKVPPGLGPQTSKKLFLFPGKDL